MLSLKILTPAHLNDINKLFNKMNKHIADCKFFKPHNFDFKNAKKVCFASNKKYPNYDFYFGFFNKDELVGYALLRTFNKKYKTPSLGMYIIPEFRGFGYGKFLLQKILQFAAFYFSDIMLSVMKENDRAIHIYKQSGFIKKSSSNDRFFYYKKL